MLDKAPQNLSVFHTALASAMFLLSCGLRYAQKLFKGKPFRFGEFLFELISSVFVGTSFYLIFKGLGLADFTAEEISSDYSDGIGR